MHVFPTKDISVIHAIFSIPYIYSQIKDDSCPEDPKNYNFSAIIDSWIFLEVRKYHNSKACGIFMFKPIDDITCEAHTLLTKDCRGTEALEAGALAKDWVFDNTKFTKISSYSFSDSPSVKWFAKKLGMVKVSEEPWEATRNGNKITLCRYLVEKQNK